MPAAQVTRAPGARIRKTVGPGFQTCVSELNGGVPPLGDVCAANCDLTDDMRASVN